MMTALRAKYARHGASTDSSFAGSSAASWAEVLPRQTVSQTLEAAAAAPAAVDKTASSTPAPAPSLFRTADAPCAESASGDAPPAAAFRAIITPSCTGRPVTEHTTTATAAAAAAARHQRHREMVQLIDQLRSVDVGRLADRMAVLSASAPSPASRTPWLLWRQGREASALEVDNDRSDGRYNDNNRELAELLRHTAVFLNFFSQCASRFLLLAEEEERLADAALTTPEGASPSRAPPQLQERQAAVEMPQRPPHHGDHTTCGRQDNAEQMRRGAGGLPHRSGSHRHDHLCGGSSRGGNAERAARGTDTSASSSKTHMEHPATIVSTPVHCAASSPTPSAAAAAPVHSREVDHADATVSSHHRRSSCVRGIRQLPLPSTLPPRSSSASPPPRATGQDEDRVTSVGNRGGGSRSPTYRTTTVSPLTSPKDRRSGHSPHTPSQPRYSRGGAVPRASAAATTVRAPAGQRSSSSPLESSPAATPPRPPTSPPMHGGALVVRSPPSPLARRRVHTWTPSSQLNHYAAACAALQSGDCVVLQPGVYYEELVLDDCGHVELTSAYPGAAVVLRPSSDLAPALRIRGAYSRVELKGVVLVQGEWVEAEGAAASVAPRSSFSTAPPLPLLSVSDGAALQATACHFYGGAGGGVVIAGPHTHATLDLCLISLCGFAGIYVHHGASVEVRQSKVKKSEAGLRVLQSSFYVHESTLEENKTDGIVVYEGGVGVLEGSSVMNNGGNGLFLEGGAGEEVRVIASTIELNALYGVHRFRGSTLHIRSSYIRDNGLLPISEDGG
ncbi:Right_handed_beta_helix_region/Periplasmic_copper-binding_protein_(NosD)_-_putative [Leishmania major strain Friedlin]|nr:Right_handed_beta_helix_region/Periplasmic_copper-binding_protein_(NosD)_-_putative [Leishmania major strain Friedlin]